MSSKRGAFILFEGLDRSGERRRHLRSHVLRKLHHMQAPASDIAQLRRHREFRSSIELQQEVFLMPPVSERRNGW